jgi:hypothetical protein
MAAERLRQVIACTEFRDDKGQLLPISASFGIAEYDPQQMPSEKELKEACDQALYHGKQNGRNLVVLGRARNGFAVVERSGDPSREVKRRMGLAGDNSPLEAAATTGNSESGVVDCVVRPPNDPLERLHTNVSGTKPAVPEPKPRRKYTRRKLKPAPVDEAATPIVEAPVKPTKPRRRRAPRRKPALTEAQKLAAESDRLDFLTDEEGAQLAAGTAPSKRLRNTVAKEA